MIWPYQINLDERCNWYLSKSGSAAAALPLPQWQLEWNPAVAVEDRGLRAVVQPNTQLNNYHWCWNAIIPFTDGFRN